MKRYKQSILSDYFVTRPELGLWHIVEANYDIEGPSNRTLCANKIVHHAEFEVLSNKHLRASCNTCKAILDQRISNMPGLRKHHRLHDTEPRQFELPVRQLGLDL